MEVEPDTSEDLEAAVLRPGGRRTRGEMGQHDDSGQHDERTVGDRDWWSSWTDSFLNGPITRPIVRRLFPNAFAGASTTPRSRRTAPPSASRTTNLRMSRRGSTSSAFSTSSVSDPEPIGPPDWIGDGKTAPSRPKPKEPPDRPPDRRPPDRFLDEEILRRRQEVSDRPRRFSMGADDASTGPFSPTGLLPPSSGRRRGVQPPSGGSRPDENHPVPHGHVELVQERGPGGRGTSTGPGGGDDWSWGRGTDSLYSWSWGRGTDSEMGGDDVHGDGRWFAMYTETDGGGSGSSASDGERHDRDWFWADLERWGFFFLTLLYLL